MTLVIQKIIESKKKSWMYQQLLFQAHSTISLTDIYCKHYKKKREGKSKNIPIVTQAMREWKEEKLLEVKTDKKQVTRRGTNGKIQVYTQMVGSYIANSEGLSKYCDTLLGVHLSDKCEEFLELLFKNHDPDTRFYLQIENIPAGNLFDHLLARIRRELCNVIIDHTERDEINPASYWNDVETYLWNNPEVIHELMNKLFHLDLEIYSTKLAYLMSKNGSLIYDELETHVWAKGKSEVEYKANKAYREEGYNIVDTKHLRIHKTGQRKSTGEEEYFVKSIVSYHREAETIIDDLKTPSDRTRAKVVAFLRHNHATKKKGDYFDVRKVAAEIGETPNTVKRIMEEIDDHQKLRFRVQLDGEHIKITKAP